MNNIDKFLKNGYMVINVDYQPSINNIIICVKNGLWYKFNIDEIEELENGTFNITTSTLISIDGKFIK